MSEQIKNNKPSINYDSMNIYEIISKYFMYWPWIVISMIICVCATYLYTRTVTPVYNIKSLLLIKEQDSRSSSMSSANGAIAALQDLGGFSMTNNFDNELEVLRSHTLVSKVVTDLNLYISTVKKNKFSHDTPFYKNSPVNVFITPEEAEKLEAPVVIDMKYINSKKIHVELIYLKNRNENIIRKEVNELPTVIPTPVGVFTLSENPELVNDSIDEDNNEEIRLLTTIYQPSTAASAYTGNLVVEATSKTTTIAILSVNDTSKDRGIDFINCLVSNYNKDANDEKNEVAQKSAEFIEDRINIINNELGTTENKLAAFKQKLGLTDLETNAKIALEQNTKYEQQRIENETQISLVNFLNNYINNPVNDNEVIPANVGLQDANLTSVIDQYNTLIIERKRLLRTSSESNPAIVNLNTGIEAIRNSVKTTVLSVLEGLQIAKKDLEKQSRRLETRINDAPQQEKEFLTISRQQEIKATLYIMLLQKREENAMTLAATANNGRIIEKPLASKVPVYPRKKVSLFIALIFGFFVPIGYINFKNILKFKIENKSDVQSLTNAPIIGILPKCQTDKSQDYITIKENENNILEEMFRNLRTNLLFMLNENEKVVLVTSTIPGEGKSFVSSNIAISLAYLGKKTVIVGLDIRKPRLSKVFKINRKSFGITNYLNNPSEVEISDIITNSGISNNLDVIPGGIVPPNPTELLARKALDNIIDKLKETYDYVIIDTAPVGMVTDTATISRVADVCVYVCRANKTPKMAFKYINELISDKRFPKIATVLNNVNISKHKNYGYGYGYGYNEKK